MLGQYSMKNSTALTSELQLAITYWMVSELCNSNSLHFNGFNFVIINELQRAQVCNNKPGILTHVLFFAMQRINTLCLSGVVRSIKSVNTTVGRMSFAIAVICQLLNMSVVKAASSRRLWVVVGISRFWKEKTIRNTYSLLLIFYYTAQPSYSLTKSVLQWL